MNPENSQAPSLPTTPSPELTEHASLPLESGEEAAQHYRYGGFLTRFFATFIDSLILFLGVGLVGLLLSLMLDKDNTAMSAASSIMQVLMYFVSPLYYLFFLHRYGATPGKKALHLKVVTINDHKPLGIWQIIMREIIGKMLSGFFGNLGYFWYLFDEKRQTWHDKLAHTVVIDTREISESAYLAWKDNQKSSLPLFTLISAVTPLFFLMVIFGVTQIPQFQQYVLHGYPLVSLLLTILMVALSLHVIAFIVVSVMLYKKQLKSPFLEGTPRKIGVGLYIFFQIFIAVVLIAMFVFGAIFTYTKFAEYQNTPSLPSDYTIDRENEPIPTGTSASASANFEETMNTLEPLVQGKKWGPMVVDTPLFNPYKTTISGYSRTYDLPTSSNKMNYALLSDYHQNLVTTLPEGFKDNFDFSADGVDGSVTGYTQIKGNQARIIVLSYQATSIDFSPERGPTCPCGGKFVVFYSNPVDRKMLTTAFSDTL